MKLRDLPNLGAVNERKLHSAGIMTVAQLYELGSEKAFMKIRNFVDSDACLHLLMALEGAIQGVKKSSLDDKRKIELKRFYNIQTSQRIK